MDAVEQIEAQHRDQAINVAKNLIQKGFWVLDLETTGFDRAAQPVELGLVDSAGLTVLHKYVMPTVPISPKALDTHGLSLNVLAEKGAVEWSKVAAALGFALQSPPAAIVIHNKDYDLRILKQVEYSLPPGIPVVCSLQMSRILDPENAALDGSHDALGDCLKVIERIRRFADMELSGVDEPIDRSAASAANMIAQVKEIAAQIKQLEKRKKILETALVDILATTEADSIGQDQNIAELRVSWQGVKVAPGFTVEDVAALYPQLCQMEPALKTYAARSIPAIVKENHGKLPQCLIAEPVSKLKIKTN